MPLSELAAAIADVDLGGYKGINVADPAADQDAATKKYHNDNKYTDTEAVAAVVAADEYVKNTGDIINLATINDQLKIDRSVGTHTDNPFPLLIHARINAFQCLEKTVSAAEGFFKITNATYLSGEYIPLLWLKSKGGSTREYAAGFVIDSHVYPAGSICSFMARYQNGVIPSGSQILFDFVNYYAQAGGTRILAIRANNRIDFLDHYIANPKNHADATLSGTPKVVEIDIGGTPYYFKVYPTKT